MEDLTKTEPQDNNQIDQNINNQLYTTPQKTKTNFSILLIIFIYFLIFGFGGYYLGRQFNKSVDNINTPNKQTIDSSVSKTPTIADPALNSGISPTLNQVLDTKEPTPTLKSFTTKDKKYTINYPEGWVLVDQSKWVDLYNDGKLQFEYDISISKNSHVIRTYDPIAFSPGECFFRDDTPSPECPEGNDCIVYSDIWDYVEIKNSNVYFRRQKTGEITTVNKKNILKWYFCSGKVGGFNSSAGFGDLWYETPVNYNPEIIKEMDQIISTFPNIYPNKY